jgi:CDP-6-deoxy-D-xylo-4-hexulose-3-dehydrase
MNFTWPLMKNNITRSDLDAVIRFLRRRDDPILTQSKQVKAFEREWSAWLGVRHSVFVNSGASANLLTMTALRETRGLGEIIVPPLTWVSDIASVIQCGFTPVFADIDPRTLGLDTEQVLKRITRRTKAVFLTHILGYNALTRRLLAELKKRNIPLIEDVCESHGATFGGRKLGTYGLMSNFSFFYAHHMSTVEGGMVCTNNSTLYETVRMLRGHGMVREAESDVIKRAYARRHPDLTPDFIFAFSAYNVRSTEINAVLGRAQLKRLNRNNRVRTANLALFLDSLDPELYQTDFDRDGSSNYAFTLILKRPDVALRDAVMAALTRHGVQFRRGTAGGGNQLRQPYLRQFGGTSLAEQFPRCDHVHFFGFYIGNYPTLERSKIRMLCHLLNGLAA